MKSETPVSANPERLPSQSVRTVVSLFLLGHLFALAVAVVSNPQDNMTSLLFMKLGSLRFLSAYTEALWMESAYDFVYTYGNNEFVIALGSDHQIEADLTLPGGETRTIRIPDASQNSGLRYQRQKNLANNSARTVGQQGAESLVPAGLLESLMRETGAESGVIRTRRRLMQTMDLVMSTDPKTRDPNADRYWQVIYTGHGQLHDGRFSYQKVEDAGTTAPAGGAGATSSGAPATSAPPPAGPRPGTSSLPPPSTAAPPPQRRPNPR